ncbi:Hypothetical predicted protein, partial [Olea europaea subsp. europaea]
EESLKAFTINCDGLYELEWKTEVKQLLKVNLPRVPPEFKQKRPPKPYDEPTLLRRKRGAGDKEPSFDEVVAKYAQKHNMTHKEVEDLFMDYVDLDFATWELEEAYMRSKLDQLLNLYVAIRKPAEFNRMRIGVDPPLSRRRRSTIDIERWSTDDMKKFRHGEKKYPELRMPLHKMAMREYRRREWSLDNEIRQILRSEEGREFLIEIIRPSCWQGAIVCGGSCKGRNLTEAELALLSDCGLKQSVIQELVEALFMDYVDLVFALWDLEEGYLRSKFVQLVVVYVAIRKPGEFSRLRLGVDPSLSRMRRCVISLWRWSTDGMRNFGEGDEKYASLSFACHCTSWGCGSPYEETRLG